MQVCPAIETLAAQVEALWTTTFPEDKFGLLDLEQVTHGCSPCGLWIDGCLGTTVRHMGCWTRLLCSQPVDAWARSTSCYHSSATDRLTDLPNGALSPGSWPASIASADCPMLNLKKFWLAQLGLSQRFKYLDSLDPDGKQEMVFAVPDPPRDSSFYPRLQVGWWYGGAMQLCAWKYCKLSTRRETARSTRACRLGAAKRAGGLQIGVRLPGGASSCCSAPHSAERTASCACSVRTLPCLLRVGLRLRTGPTGRVPSESCTSRWRCGKTACRWGGSGHCCTPCAATASCEWDTLWQGSRMQMLRELGAGRTLHVQHVRPTTFVRRLHLFHCGCAPAPTASPSVPATSTPAFTCAVLLRPSPAGVPLCDVPAAHL